MPGIETEPSGYEAMVLAIHHQRHFGVELDSRSEVCGVENGTYRDKTIDFTIRNI
jgi:hypothetical protein